MGSSITGTASGTAALQSRDTALGLTEGQPGSFGTGESGVAHFLQSGGNLSLLLTCV